MKIVKGPKNPWWVGKTFTCSPGCGTKFKMEPKDKVIEDTDRDGYHIKVECPFCQKVNFIASR